MVNLFSLTCFFFNCSFFAIYLWTLVYSSLISTSCYNFATFAFYFSLIVMVCIYTHTLLCYYSLILRYHCRLIPFTPKYKCVSPQNKNIFLCNNSTVVKFRKLSIDIIILSNIQTLLKYYQLSQRCLLWQSYPPPQSMISYYISLVFQPFFHGTFWTAQTNYSIKFGFVWRFFRIRFRLSIFGRWHVMSLCLTTANVNLGGILLVSFHFLFCN